MCTLCRLQTMNWRYTDAEGGGREEQSNCTLPTEGCAWGVLRRRVGGLKGREPGVRRRADAGVVRCRAALLRGTTGVKGLGSAAGDCSCKPAGMAEAVSGGADLPSERPTLLALANTMALPAPVVSPGGGSRALSPTLAPPSTTNTGASAVTVPPRPVLTLQGGSGVRQASEGFEAARFRLAAEAGPNTTGRPLPVVRLGAGRAVAADEAADAARSLSSPLSNSARKAEKFGSAEEAGAEATGRSLPVVRLGGGRAAAGAGGAAAPGCSETLSLPVSISAMNAACVAFPKEAGAKLMGRPRPVERVGGDGSGAVPEVACSAVRAS